ncbi:PepSY-like domain-containing protein [Nonlabens ponticola]|uniref:Putative beta-lactamase-inhibitor-like PepSY-like domain-containing protein n=1 Tax=Nonlabens ponticola TaxID=2496866 RepID=A0A3S9MYV4_9FLAO|nr:PepSY-like domain-containing protein [Nonlabens ponticola]AZQ44338.1 hypothetical protein EJ995_08845 [Nonlabens ponticola]
MKNITILLALLFIATSASCQKSKKSEVPQAVQANFMSKYPGENDPDWKLDDHGYWESHFKIEGIKYRADFEANGAWVETETSISKKDLPEAIKSVIKDKYADRKITEVELVQHFSKGQFYDVEFKQKGKNMDVEFRSDGSIIEVN